MVVLIHQNLQLPSLSCRRGSRGRASSCMSSSDQRKLMDFPHLSATHRNLMVEIFSQIEKRIGSQLLPSSIPPDVEYFENEAGSSQGVISIRTGDKGSKIGLILGSWLHCQLPLGVLDITTLSSFLNTTTDAPHLLMEFIQSSPTSLIFIMDFLPRKDLIFDPGYLDNYYQDTQLDNQRQKLEKCPEIKPFFSSSLYIRSLLSPTAISININCEGRSSVESILVDHVSNVANEVLGIWLDRCVGGCGSGELGEMERENLLKRDVLIKNKMIELDLANNLPKLFGPDVAGRVVGALHTAFMSSAQ